MPCRRAGRAGHAGVRHAAMPPPPAPVPPGSRLGTRRCLPPPHAAAAVGAPVAAAPVQAPAWQPRRGPAAAETALATAAWQRGAAAAAASRCGQEPPRHAQTQAQARLKPQTQSCGHWAVRPCHPRRLGTRKRRDPAWPMDLMPLLTHGACRGRPQPHAAPRASARRTQPAPMAQRTAPGSPAGRRLQRHPARPRRSGSRSPRGCLLWCTARSAPGSASGGRGG